MLDDRPYRGGPRQRWHYYFVAEFHVVGPCGIAERCHGKQIGAGAGIRHQRVFGAEILGALILELADFRPHSHMGGAHLLACGLNFFFAEGGFMQADFYRVRHAVVFTFSRQ